MTPAPADGFVERNRLWARLGAAVAAHPEPLCTPITVVDLDARVAVDIDVDALAGLVDHYRSFSPLTGHPAAMLGIGELVWFRHAKSGELFEHVNDVHLVRGDRVVETVPSYRGLGHAW